MNSNMKECVFI